MMKVYLFNVDSGLYQGEAFRDAREISEDEGMTTLPPPEYHRTGHVPIYDRTVGTWKLVPVADLMTGENGND
jgi:hypothetical protein